MVKGGVIIIGSLFWEDEKNCIKGSEETGRLRRVWREENLVVDKREIANLPLRYGRTSSSRLGTYTMVFSSSYISTGGQGLIVPYLDSFDFGSTGTFLTQAQKLADVEGISEKSKWGSVAIWINPKSNTDVRNTWRSIKHARLGHRGSVNRFDWQDERLLNENYELEGLEIETELDFLMCTYICPKHRDADDNKLKKYPSAEEIATEIFSSGYATYFAMNRASGILTKDDHDIEKYLNNVKDKK